MPEAECSNPQWRGFEISVLSFLPFAFCLLHWPSNLINLNLISISFALDLFELPPRCYGSSKFDA